MRIIRVTISLLVAGSLAACDDPPPPVSVGEFMENPRLLEATMVRCGQNRSEMKYEAECINARDAVNRLERAEERERRARLEAQSERKRQQLRATQEAAAAARRRADEERRRREEAEYLGLFEDTTVTDAAVESPGGQTALPADNAPVVVAEPAAEQPVADPPDAGTAANRESATDLESIREELRRRQNVPE